MANTDKECPESLTCGICFDKVKDSKQLPCFHSFCKACLKQHIQHSRDRVTVDGESIIQCPQCRRKVPVPSNGVDGFPSSYFVMAHCAMSEIESGDMTCGICSKRDSAVGFCIECKKNLCMECKPLHKSDEDTRSHHILVMGDGSRKTMETFEKCEKHPSKEIKFYCTQCQEPCCTDCRQTMHYGHPAIDIAEAATRDRERLSEMLTDLELVIMKFQAAKERADEVRDRMNVDRERVEEEIEVCREKVRKQVDEWSEEGRAFIQEKTKTNEKNLQENYDEIKEDYQLLRRSIDETKQVLQINTDLPVVRVAKEVGNVLERYKSIQTKELDEKKLIFVPDLYKREVLARYNGLFGYEALKLKLAFTFETDHFIEYSLLPVSESEAWVSFYTSEGSALVRYNSAGEKLEDIAMKPNGHSRALKLGREFLMTSKLDKKLWLHSDKNKPWEEFASLEYPPRGIAVNQENQIILCTSESNGETGNALLVYSERGELVRTVVEDDGKKIFLSPRYVAVNINGDICVSDKGSSSVVILDKHFKVKARYIPPESLKLKSSFCPRGICCDKYGRIMVADGCNKKVHLISPKGEFLRFVLQESDGLNWPRLVANGPGDKLWVVCRGTVSVYDYLDSHI